MLLIARFIQLRLTQLLFLLILLNVIVGCGEDNTANVSVKESSSVVKAADLKPVKLGKIEQPIDFSTKKVDSDIMSLWQPHLAGLPKHWVSASEPLMIEFSHPVANSDQVDTVLADMIKVKPHIDFTASFNRTNSIRIEFDSPLKRQTVYTFYLSAEKLQGMGAKLPVLPISVAAIAQDYSIHFDGLLISNNYDDKQTSTTDNNQIIGRVITDDVADEAQLEKMLSASIGEQSLNLNWTHQNGKIHQFSLDNIKRGEQALAIDFSWDGKVIGVNKQGQQQIKVPAKKEFIVTASYFSDEGNNAIQLHFSQPLAKQSFKGLVFINGKAPKKLTFKGNILVLYPAQQLSGEVNIEILDGIRSAKKASLLKSYKQSLFALNTNPGVRFVGDDNILPKYGQKIVSIAAANIDSVQIKAYRVTKQNLGQFLQSNRLSDNRLDNQTSQLLWQKNYVLPSVSGDRWQNYQLDLTKLLTDNSNDLIGLDISIDQTNITLSCADQNIRFDKKQRDLNDNWPTENHNQPSWVRRYYQSQGYSSWSDRNNPCKSRYYHYYANPTRAFKYFTSSNLALISKMGKDHVLHNIITDIASAEPQENVTVSAFNYQHQIVAEGKTDKNGIVSFKPESVPYYVIARLDEDLSFIRLNRNDTLSTNIFDTTGQSLANGLKGTFYTERDIWRPGDDIFLTFVMLDKQHKLPKNYPLTVDLFDPNGNKKQVVVQANPVNGFYVFKLNTADDAITGNWRAVIRYGEQYFSKILPIETIVPNRLKISLNMQGNQANSNKSQANSQDLFYQTQPYQAQLTSQWLNGAKAQQLKADIKVSAQAIPTQINGYEHYIFDDPSRKINTNAQVIFDVQLNQDGEAHFLYQPNYQNSPGQLKLNFTTRVFEKGGLFSTQYSSQNYLAFDQLVGLSIPKGRGWNNAISRDENHTIKMVSVTNQGKASANKTLTLTVHKLGWRWWWDYSQDNIAKYLTTNNSSLLVNRNLTTDELGHASWRLTGNEFDWGRYFIRVCDQESQHCAGKIIYLGWSYQASKNPSAESQLMLTTDKTRYQVGDIAYLTLPQSLPNPKHNSVKYLLSLENGTRVLSLNWVENDIKNNRLAIPITAEMTPNVYAHLTLIQSHQDKTNDSPLRLYGIVPLLVDNPNNQLQPVLVAPQKVKPQSEFTLKVTEKNQQGLTYTLAVVDEGLLGITNYQTPDLTSYFYQREALGVLTWDMYDQINRANNQMIQNRLTLGGSDSQHKNKLLNEKRRFAPIVQFYGPFDLKPGGENAHQIKLPEYIGEVRAMVVAGDLSQANKAKFGHAQQSITVTQPLTLLATLPRVLAPNEALTLPVHLFVTDNSIKRVSLTITGNELFEFGQTKIDINFDKMGEQLINLPIKTKELVGDGQITITARVVETRVNNTVQTAIADESISQTINIKVRSANSLQTESASSLIKAGETKQLSLPITGLVSTNTTWFELSKMPQINLQQHLEYLLAYPHGCLEQTTSQLFAQLYLPKLSNLNDSQVIEIEANISSGIEQLKSFQVSDGNFTYWAGGHDTNYWANVYAGHFLVTAKNLGYFVPDELLQNWLSAQQIFVNRQQQYQSAIAYALYVLALANQPDFAAMNRLKARLQAIPQDMLTNEQRISFWLLSAAYAKVGIIDAGIDLYQSIDSHIKPYAYAGYNYGSQQRDLAIKMLAEHSLAKKELVWETATQLAHQLNNQTYLSTQTRGWTLLALAESFAAVDSELPFSYQINHETTANLEENKQQSWQTAHLNKLVFKQALNNSNTKSVSVSVKNESTDDMHFVLSNSGIPANNLEKPGQSKVSLKVEFTDMNGQAIDISKLVQGTDFKAIVSVFALDNQAVSFPQLENLALTMTMPSGWQVDNARLQGQQLSAGLDAQDIRDDRILSYFSLNDDTGRRHRNQGKISQNNAIGITIETVLNASFKGKFYLPAWHVNAMYNDDVWARNKGQWVEVVADSLDKNSHLNQKEQ